MKRLALLLGLLTLACLSGDVRSAPSACPTHFVNGEAPETAARFRATTREVCLSAFAVLHDGTTRTPVYSAEHLTADAMRQAAHLPRKDSFHPELALPANERAELRDYAHSGWSRGHMSPNADQPDAERQHESFSLANMVPQDQNDNGGVWAHIEAAVRKLAVADGDVYVVTGPIFDGELRLMHGRVAIPDRLFKAVYDPAQHAAAVYVVHNAPGSAWEAISLDELRDLTGLDAFPGVAADLLALPAPAGAK